MFTRKTVEELVSKMINWTQGSTNKLTDFRVGSKVRTIYEATALIVEEFYDKMFRSLRKLIEDTIYSAFGFDAIGSTFASGIVTFSRSEIADQDYPIPMGTLIQRPATGGTRGMNYRTTEDAILQMGTTSVDVNIVCDIAGEIGNTGALSVTEIVASINGVEKVINLTSLTNGADEETKEAQKARFQRFIEANARGILPAIEYGAKLALIRNPEGQVIERVVQAKALEDLPARIGEVDVFLWNGVDGASEALLAEARKRITGYYGTEGEVVYGYKSAGAWLNMYVAPLKEIHAKVVFTTEDWLLPTDAHVLIIRVIDEYFAKLAMGQEVVQTTIEATVKEISGIYDVKLYLSTNGGVSYSTENITTELREIAVMKKPLILEGVRRSDRDTGGLIE